MIINEIIVIIYSIKKYDSQTYANRISFNNITKIVLVTFIMGYLYISGD